MRHFSDGQSEQSGPDDLTDTLVVWTVHTILMAEVVQQSRVMFRIVSSNCPIGCHAIMFQSLTAITIAWCKLLTFRSELLGMNGGEAQGFCGNIQATIWCNHLSAEYDTYNRRVGRSPFFWVELRNSPPNVQKTMLIDNAESPVCSCYSSLTFVKR
jgi:hypothetical protein